MSLFHSYLNGFGQQEKRISQTFIERYLEAILGRVDRCPSKWFVLFEIIDKFACASQAVIMMKTLGNLVLLIWSKIKASSNLAAENLALRQQLAVMKRRNKRPIIRKVDRLFWVLLSRIWTPWRKSLVILKPDTVVHWNHKGFKFFWKFKSKGRGRPNPD